MDVRAAVCHAPNTPLVIETVQLREPHEDEVLIEILATGLCHSDLHQIDGSVPTFPYPVICGHEGAGIVRGVGSNVRSVKVGDHVIPSAVPECGVCPNCRSGLTNVCIEFFSGFSRETPYTLDGKPVAQYTGTSTFANFTVVREIQVAKVREDVSADLCCYVGCGVITGLGSALVTAKVTPGSRVVVFGLGGIGLNVIQGAKIAGARQIIGVDLNPRREAQGRQFGLTHFVNPKEINGDVLEHLNILTEGGADFTFECVGNTKLQAQAIDASRHGLGVATIVGVPAAGQELTVNSMQLMTGRTIKGGILGGMRTRTDVPKVLDWYKDGLVQLDALVTHRLKLEEINEGFALMKRGESIRAVVIF